MLRSSSNTTGIGSEPARRITARSAASWELKLPVITPLREMRSRITGALFTWLSITIASRLPTFSPVSSPKMRAPSLSHWNSTCHSERRESKPIRASSRYSPVMAGFSSIR